MNLLQEFGKDIKNILRGGLPVQPFEIIDIKDEPNTDKSKADPFLRVSRLAEGGRVNYYDGKIAEDYPVPNAPPVPRERKDRMGDQSYATQASAEPLNPFTGEPYTAIYKPNV